jgi:hypothetical protein
MIIIAFSSLQLAFLLLDMGKIKLSLIVHDSPLQPMGGPCLSPAAADHPLRPAKDRLAWTALT